MKCISAVVLAGGKSARLGRNKAFLEIDGETLVARAVSTLLELSDDIIVVTNDPQSYEPLHLPARLVPDELPGHGSLMGIYSGLKHARHSHALAVACDMPFLKVSLLRYMVELVEGYDVVIPRVEGLLEPLHAIYARSCLPAMRSLLDQGRRRIVAFFPEVRVRYVEEQEIARFDADYLSFLNVNTPEDWAHVQRLVSDSDG